MSLEEVPGSPKHPMVPNVAPGLQGLSLSDHGFAAAVHHGLRGGAVFVWGKDGELEGFGGLGLLKFARRFWLYEVAKWLMSPRS